MKSKKIALVILLLLVLLAVVLFALRNHQYKYVSNYSDSDYHYTCSKALKAELQEVQFEGGKSKIYVPINKSEASQYCKMTGAY